MRSAVIHLEHVIVGDPGGTQALIKDVNVRSKRLAKYLPHYWKSGSNVWTGVDIRRMSLKERLSRASSSLPSESGS